MGRGNISNKDILRCAGKALVSSTKKMVARNRMLYRATALLVAFATVFTMGFGSPVLYAENTVGERYITAIGSIDEEVAVQHLAFGASESDIVFPDSINATVETYKEVLIEEEVLEEALEEEMVEETVDVESDVPATEEVVETEENSENEEVEEVLVPESDQEVVEENVDGETTEATEETVVEEVTETTETTEAAEPTVDSTESTPVESAPAAESTPAAESAAPSEDNGSDPVAFVVDLLFPAMVAQAAEDEQAEESAPAAEESTSTAEPTYRVETVSTSTEITLSGISWTIDAERSTSATFDSSIEGAKYVYVPSIPGEYKVNTNLPTITVIIGTAELSPEFEQSVVVDGVLITVKADAGVFPEGAQLSASRASEEVAEIAENAVDELEEETNVITSYVFDISVLDQSGNEIQPDTSKGQVIVSFSVESVADEETTAEVYHIPDINNASEVVEKLETKENGLTAEAETTSFSPYVLRLTGIGGIVDIGNNGYPYGKRSTGNSITFVVDIENASAGTYQWYVSDNGTTNYTAVAGASGDITSETTIIETTFTTNQTNNRLEDGKWYKVRFNNNEECETIPVQAFYNNDSKAERYYVSNGQMAYAIIDDFTFDVIGKYQGRWVKRTSYDGYWNWYTSSSANPNPITIDDVTPEHENASIKDNRSYFLENDYDGSQDNSTTSGAHALFFQTTINDSEHAFGYSCDVMIQSNDDAPCMGVFSQGKLKQIQLVDAPAINEHTDPNSAALVVRTDVDGDFPSKYYIGYWCGRQIFEYATRSNGNAYGTAYNSSVCTFDAAGHGTMISGADSGISVSWNELSAGATINYAFNLGTVAQTGAVTGKVDYEKEQVKVDKANTTYTVTVINEDGSEGRKYDIISDNEKGIPLSGTDNTGNPYDFCGEKIEITEYGSNNQPAVLDIQPRPLAEDADTDGTDDTSDARRPVEVGEDNIVTTETTITLNIDPSYTGRMLQEYRVYDTTGTNPISGWVKPATNGKVTFTGLTPDTDYVIKARVPANVNTPASAVTSGVHARTKGSVTYTLPAANDTMSYNAGTNTYQLTYDGIARKLQITAEPSDAIVSYSLDENTEYSSNVPALVNAGEYTVYFKATKENFRTAYGSFNVQIGKQASESYMVYADEPLKINAAATQNGQAILTSQIEGLRADDTVALLNDGYNLPYSEEFDNIITDITVNSDTVYYSVNDSAAGTTGYIYLVVENDNYSEYILVVPVVTVEDYEVTVPTVEDTTITYDGQDHEFPVTVDVENAVITYSVGSDDEYTEKTPVFTEEGEYEVFYKVEKNGVVYEEGSFIVTIKAQDPIEVVEPVEETAEAVYDGEEHSFPVIIEDKDAVVKYSDTEDGVYTEEAPKFKEVGEYTVFYLVEKNGKEIQHSNYAVRIVNPIQSSSSRKHYGPAAPQTTEAAPQASGFITEAPAEVVENATNAQTTALADMIETEGIGLGNIIDRGDIWGNMSDNTKQKLLDKLNETGGEIIQADDLENMDAVTVKDTPVAFVIGEGSVIVKLEYKGDTSTTNASLADATAVANSILTAEQRAAVAAGSILEIKVEVTPLDKKAVPEADRKVIDDGANSYKEELPDLTMADYLDISMFFRIDEEDWNRITDTDPIDIVIDIPQNYLGLSDDYYIMRAHQGASTLLSDIDEDPNTITISTGQFSTYALMYNQPQAVGTTLEIGHVCHVHWMILVVAVVGVAGIYVGRRRRRVVYAIDLADSAAMIILSGLGTCYLDFAALIIGVAALAVMTHQSKETAEQRNK